MKNMTELTAYERLSEVLIFFNDMYKNIPSQTIIHFLTVAKMNRAGKVPAMYEIAKELNTSQAAVSRNLGILAGSSRGNQTALGLIELTPDIGERRINRCELTEKGWSILTKIENILAL